MRTPRACNCFSPWVGFNKSTKVLVGLLVGGAVDSSAGRGIPRGRLMCEREFGIALVTPFIGIEKRRSATLRAPAIDLCGVLSVESKMVPLRCISREL